MSILTVKCKLDPTPEQRESLDRTLVAFADGCNHALRVGRETGTTSKAKIQMTAYHEIRAATGLSANLAIRAINRAAGILKVSKRKGSADFRPRSGDVTSPSGPSAIVKPGSIDYDQRIFSFREADWTVSLTTVAGRHKGVVLLVGDYQKDLLRGQSPTSATVWKTRQGDYYIGIQVKRDDPVPPEAEEFIGVDLGIAQVAVTSDGAAYSGEHVDRVRDRYARTRASLQRKGTRGARRVLRTLTGRERRFMADTNHKISKQIVREAKGSGRGIRLEDLTGIRDRVRVRKAQRHRHHRWAFYQLRQFLAYKATLAGVPLELVDPAYTSRTCPECGYSEKANRKSQARFECHSCGYAANADLVGAINIANGGVVNRREETSNDAEGLAHSVKSGEAEGSFKPTALAVDH